MKKLLIFAPLGLFSIFALMLGLGLKHDPTLIPSVLIDKPMPDFALAAVQENGQGLAKDDLKGHVSLVNVFASWCVVCAEEHPTLMDLSRAKSVALYGIDWKDAPNDGNQWLARNGNPYSRAGNDENGRVAIDLGVSGAPETFVVDKAGRIRFKQIGAITPDVWERTLRPMIAKLESEQ